MFVRFPQKCKLEIQTQSQCPVVVHFHGGPEGQSAPVNTMAQALLLTRALFC